MSDEIIKIAPEITAAQKSLDLLAMRAGRLRPALKAMGEHLAISTDDRFTRETGPDGKKWQAVTARTRKRKRHSKILTEDGFLRGGMHPEVGDDTLLFGTDSPYGAIHQLGGEIEKKEQQGRVMHFRPAGGNRKDGTASKAQRIAKAKDSHSKKEVTIGAHKIVMPARPFLGVSATDEMELLAIAGDYLTG